MKKYLNLSFILVLKPITISSMVLCHKPWWSFQMKKKKSINANFRRNKIRIFFCVILFTYIKYDILCKYKSDVCVIKWIFDKHRWASQIANMKINGCRTIEEFQQKKKKKTSNKHRIINDSISEDNALNRKCLVKHAVWTNKMHLSKLRRTNTNNRVPQEILIVWGKISMNWIVQTHCSTERD